MVNFKTLKLDETKREEQINQLFSFWKQVGFPMHEKSDYDYKKELSDLIKLDEQKLLVDKDIKQTMHGCGFLWCYFPHWIDVRCGNDLSVSENWNDDEKLRTLITKTYNYELKHNDGNFTLNRLRQNAKVYCAKQSVSNFRPSVAKLIYDKYGNHGTVWDMSSGFGGRLLGFLASDCNTYIGTDPSTKTYNGLKEMVQDFSYVGKNVKLYKKGSEEYKPKKDSLDLCFTSPPYFDTEKYSDEPTQSYLRFNTQDKWINGFLKKNIRKLSFWLKTRWLFSLKYC